MLVNQWLKSEKTTGQQENRSRGRKDGFKRGGGKQLFESKQQKSDTDLLGNLFFVAAQLS